MGRYYERKVDLGLSSQCQSTVKINPKLEHKIYRPFYVLKIYAIIIWLKCKTYIKVEKIYNSWITAAAVLIWYLR